MRRFALVRLSFICWLLVGTGLLAQAAGDPTAADRHRALAEIERADRLLAANPKNAEALAARAGAATALGIRTAAYESINRLEEIAPKHPQLDDWREALQLINPDATETVMALAAESGTQLAGAQTQAAADLLRVAELMLPDVTPEGFGPWTLRVIRGDNLAADGHLELARTDYEEAKGPDGKMTAEAHVSLGRMWVKSGDFEAALATLAAVPADAGQDAIFAPYWTAKAHAARYAKSHGFDDAEKAYQIFSSLADADPEDADYPRERDALRQIVSPAERVRLRPSATSVFAEIKALRERGELTDARQRLNLLLLRHPRLAEGYALRAEIATSPAAAALDRKIAQALRDPPTRPSAKDDFAAANAAIAQRPYASDPYVQRARVLLARNDAASTERALQDATTAVGLDAYDPQALAALAEAQVARNRHVNVADFAQRDRNRGEALATADRAVALAPEDVGLLQWRGDFAGNHGEPITQRPAQAMRFYTQALRLDPASSALLLRRARAAGEAERKAEAVADYLEILRLNQADVAARYELGLSQLSLGRFAEAEATFETLQAAFPLEAGDTSSESLEVAQLQVLARAARNEPSVDRAQALLARAAWSTTASDFLFSLRQRKLHAAELDRLAALKSN